MQDEILEFLYNNEGHTENDILQYFIDKFPDSNKDNMQYAQTVLISLLEKRLISVSTPFILTPYDSFTHMKNQHGLTGHYGIMGRITFEGKNHVENKRRDIKQDKLNASFKKMNDETIPKNNTIQIGLTSAIVLATIVTVIISWLTYTKDRDSRKSQDTLIQSLTDKLKSTEELLNKKVASDSVFHKAVKDSLKMP